MVIVNQAGCTFLDCSVSLSFFNLLNVHIDCCDRFEPLEGLVSVKPEDYLQHLRSLSKQNLELDKLVQIYV